MTQTGSTTLFSPWLLLGLHDGTRAWKGFDWDALGRLHQKGLISNPVGKAKSGAKQSPWSSPKLG